MKVQTKSKKVNKAWLHDHVHDTYVKLAQKEGYRSRAAYKLKEIDENLKLIRPGQLVVDLGACPGAWSQYVRRKFAPKETGAGGAAAGELNHLRRRRRRRRGQGRSQPSSSTSCATPQKFQKLGGRIPKGVLLVGRRAPARRCSRAPSPARRTCRSSRSAAPTSSRCSSASAPRACATCSSRRKKNAPCIIFIDEIDAVGRHRGAGLGGGHDEREQTLNQLLVEMDGFESNEGVIVIAATNRPDVLDPALLRPGRFDRQVVVRCPTCGPRGRSSRSTCARSRWPPTSTSDVIARGTPGFSGADLANLVNEAALFAARYNKKVVSTWSTSSAPRTRS
jgi:hypothetical protein